MILANKNFTKKRSHKNELVFLIKWYTSYKKQLVNQKIPSLKRKKIFIQIQ